MSLQLAQQGVILASVLFSLGLAGLLLRRDLVFILLSIEIMLNATGLAFVSAGARHGGASGQVMFIFILSMAASEVAVGLALVLRIQHRMKTLDADAIDRMRG